MSNSSLVDVVILSPHCNKPRMSRIKKITPHHMAGNGTVESCGKVFNGVREASSNYSIGSDGRVGLHVEECNRAWTSSSPDNDHQAVTIEVANDGGEDTGWHVSDKALNKLIDLCVDICERNNIPELVYTGDSRGNLTRHNMFVATTCPGPYLQSKFPYIAEEVNRRLRSKQAETQTEQVEQVEQTKSCFKMSEVEIYNYLVSKGLTPAGVCGLMGNLYAESGLNSNNLQNNGNRILGVDDNEFTLIVDTCAYNKEAFIRDGYGYGLAQWTYWSRKEALYNFVQANNASIGCTKTQLDFLVQELEGYKGVIEVLRTTSSVREASNVVLLYYERPADQSEQMQDKRYSFGMVYYDKYVQNTVTEEPNIKVGDTVKLKPDAKQYNGNNIRADYMSKEYTLTQLNGTRAVLSIGNTVIYAVNVNDLLVVNNKIDTPVFEPYTIKVNTGQLNYRQGPGVEYPSNGLITDRGVYTIVEEQNGWGRLKSGAGWICLDYTVKL